MYFSWGLSPALTEELRMSDLLHKMEEPEVFTPIREAAVEFPLGDRVWWCNATQAWWGWEASTGEYYTSDSYTEILADLAYI